MLLTQLESVSRLAECNQLLRFGQFENRRLGRDDLRGEIENVAAVITVLRYRQAVGCRHDRGTELVHLDTSVIDVELLGDARARRSEYSRDRIPHGRPPGMP